MKQECGTKHKPEEKRMKKPVYGFPPEQCDVCHAQLADVVYDSRSVYGPCAWMCPNCFETIGTGLGIGLGQMFRKQPDGKFLKEAG